MKTFLKGCAYTLLFFVLVVASTALLVLEEQPLVAVDSAKQVERAQTIPQLMHDLKTVLTRDQAFHEVNLSSEQINSLLGFMQRAHAPFAGAFFVQQAQGRLFITYRIEFFGVTRFINAKLILASGIRFTIAEASLGKLPVPGNWLIDAARYGVNWHTQSDIADVAYHTLQGVEYEQQHAKLIIAPVAPLLSKIREVQMQLGDDLPDALDHKIAHYLDFLVLNHQYMGEKHGSLAPYLREVFLEAQIQSGQYPAVIENQAAIFAMTIFFAEPRFSRFFNLPDKAVYRLGVQKQVTLAGRRDLALHFLFSASFELLAEASISVAIGEFKELMDRNQQGSGYSFVDLAADKAGIHFASVATSPRTALAVQQLLATRADEELYLPNLDALPEGLNVDTFNDVFERVDSPKYQAYLAEIISRIDALPITAVPSPASL
jgi:hypothetical protein